MKQGIGQAAESGVSLEAPPRPEDDPLHVDYDNWDLTWELRNLGRLSQGPRVDVAATPAAFAVIHPPHLASHEPPPEAATGTFQPRKTNAAVASLSDRLAWVLMIVGLAGILCGGCLAASIIWGTQGDVVGRGMLLIGCGTLVLLIGRALQGTHAQRGTGTSERLGTIDARLKTLETKTAELSTLRGAAAQAFYTHLADGASPKILLADLKGQLDLLAARLSQRG